MSGVPVSSEELRVPAVFSHQPSVLLKQAPSRVACLQVGSQLRVPVERHVDVAGDLVAYSVITNVARDVGQHLGLEQDRESGVAGDEQRIGLRGSVESLLSSLPCPIEDPGDEHSFWQPTCQPLLIAGW
jgi:hypothetical protein